MKKMLAMLLTISLLLGASFALADTITMGTNASFAPFEYIGDSGEPEGFDIDIAKIIAEEMGKELKIEDIYFDGLIAALDVGTVDFVIAAMTITEEKKEAALFTNPYLSANQAVIVLEGYEGIKTTDDIADKKVAVQDGTTGFFLAIDTLGVAEANVAAFKASPDTVLELTSGRVDCIIIDNAVAEEFVKNYEGLTIVEGLEMPVEEYGIAVKFGNEDLLEEINAILAKIQEDGRFDEIYAKYFQ